MIQRKKKKLLHKWVPLSVLIQNIFFNSIEGCFTWCWYASCLRPKTARPTWIHGSWYQSTSQLAPKNAYASHWKRSTLASRAGKYDIAVSEVFDFLFCALTFFTKRSMAFCISVIEVCALRTAQIKILWGFWLWEILKLY